MDRDHGCTARLSGLKGLDKLTREGLDVQLVKLDLVPRETAAAPGRVRRSRFGKVDILVNSAGIADAKTVRRNQRVAL